MKKVFIILMSLFAIMSASMGLKAQEVTILLRPGWNWIGYPYPESVDLENAFVDFEPMNDDVIQSFWGYSEYAAGYGWFGAVDELQPGWGYMYYSNRTEAVIVELSAPASQTTVTTNEPTNITAESAVAGGTVTVPEGTHVFLRGVCWGTAPNPDIDGDHSSEETGVGVFNSTLEGLSPGTTYYVRAYAVTDYGLDYGNEMSFTTLFLGSLNGLFSVGENTQVCFSQGNLQYQASTNTWRFAENQWDYVGEGNGNASPTYEGWIDLFSWGTSGYDHGAVCYQPWTQGGQLDHAAYGNRDYDLCDGNGQADWGYNAISNSGNQERLWRTCKSSEWQYLLQNRQTPSGIRFAKAVVNGRNGLIILPDDWDPSVYVLNNTNEGNVSFEANTISAEDWNSLLENNGAVFLPATDMEGNTHGAYWTASATGSPWLKRRIDFSNNNLNVGGSYYPHVRYAVRLVRSAPTNPTYSFEAVPNPYESGTVSGAGNYDYYASVVLTATPNEGYTFYQWKENGKGVFMDNPSSFVSLFDRSLEACFLENSTYPLLYTFNENNHTATVIGHWDGQGATGDLVIPETVMHNGEAYTVTAIGGDAFFGYSGLTSVVLPNSLNSIGSYAFDQCSGLTSIEIPEGVTSIGSQAFTGTSIVSMAIPESVTSLGNQVFYGCGNLTSVTLPSGITSLGYGLFQYCGSLSSITIPAGVIWISQYAFLGCGLTSITILAEVSASIHEQAFESVNKSIPVYVPCGTLEAYQNANGWNEFTNINEMCPGVITVTANSAEYGTVSGGGSFEGGEICTVTATPNQGYFFESWTENGEVVSTDATYSFIVTGDRNLVANFSRHDYVDLGLPSGTLWATCNVGADNPEDYGDYFAWGETQPKSYYDWGTYQYYDGNNLTKYTGSDGLTILLPEDDAATANWGSDWRMPTEEEWQELYNNTTHTWTTQNGVNGRLFTASNGNSLFLPAAGYRGDSSLYYAGSYGGYWSSSLDTDYPGGAWNFYFNSDYYYVDGNGRYYGQSVRGVRSSRQN